MLSRCTRALFVHQGPRVGVLFSLGPSFRFVRDAAKRTPAAKIAVDKKPKVIKAITIAVPPKTRQTKTAKVEAKTNATSKRGGKKDDKPATAVSKVKKDDKPVKAVSKAKATDKKKGDQAKAAEKNKAVKTPVAKATDKQKGDQPKAAERKKAVKTPVVKTNVGAPELLLAHNWDKKIDPTGWWMSEKLDGVRALWTGTQFVSREGNVFPAPDWFIKEMPKNVELDGELFAGRDKFQDCVGIVRSSQRGDEWKRLKFKIFDVPNLKATFENRCAWMKSNIIKYRVCSVITQGVCKSLKHMNDTLAKIEKEGGEGLMLRKPGSFYEGKRSRTLLKVKSHDDYEALVVGHENGKGRCLFLCGALICELPNGKQFKIGSGMKDGIRALPPPIGTVVTFRFQGLTKAGIPRFPRFVGQRADGKWPPSSPWPPQALGAVFVPMMKK